MSQELYLQIILDENGSIATVNNLGQAIAKAGGESEGASGKVDKLSDSFDKSESTTSSLIGTLKGLGIAYAALRIERTIEGWMRLSIAQDTVDRTLKAAMISNNRYSEAFYQSTLKQAQALQRLTGEDDAVIEASQRMLMTFNSISNDSMPRATKAVLNLSVLMGAEGGGLRGATLSLGKAMEGNVEGLKRFGIVIDENVYKQKGAAGVLAAVEAKVNGQAEALAQGSGKWKILGSEIDEAKEAIGFWFTELATNSGVLEKTISLVNSLANAMKAYAEKNPEKTLRRDLESLQEFNRQLNVERKTFPIFDFIGLGENRQKVIKSLEADIASSLTKIATAPTLAETILEQTKELGPVAEAVHKLTDEEKKVAKALEEVNDIIAKSTLTEYGLEVYELDKKFKGLRETLGDNKGLIEAYGLGKSAIYSKFIEAEKTAIITSLKEQDKERQTSFDKYNKLTEEATALWDKYSDNVIFKLFKQEETVDDLIKKWSELANKVNEAKIRIADDIINNRSGWDTFFPSEKTIQAFETTSKLAIKNINDELNKNLKISGITDEQKSILTQDAANKTLEINKKLTENMYSGWKELSDSIAHDFASAFESILVDGTGTFKKLGDALRHSFAHVISGVIEQDILKPFMSQLSTGLQGNFVPANFTGPLAPGQQYAPAWMGSYGPKVLGALGAGGVGYGIGQMAGQSGIGSGFGAMAGYAIGGVPGAMALGIGGMIIEGLTGGGGADIPSPAEIARTAFAENMKSAFRDVIGQGITEGLKSGDFSSFEKSLKASLGNMVVESFKTLMISQMLTPLMDLFQPFFTTMNTISQQATGNLPSPFAGKIGQGLWAKIMPQLPPLATIADATGKLPTADMLNDVIKTTLQPIFDSVTPLIQPFIDALGLNTDATKASTATLQSYNDNVDSFLAELAGGPLAPFQSSAEMQNRYNALYSAALIDPTKFPEFSSYAGGSYLPYLQGTSPNYGGDYAGMVSQTMGFKPTWGIPSLDTASSPVINPGDYAMPTVAGQTQGPGFKQMFKEALQEVLAPMLLDIANSNREDKELTGSIEIRGNLGTLVAEAITKDANARLAAHNA